MVYYAEDGSITVGQDARRMILEEPDHVVSSIKRLMGRGTEDLKTLAGTLPYTLDVAADGGMVRLSVAGIRRKVGW